MTGADLAGSAALPEVADRVAALGGTVSAGDGDVSPMSSDTSAFESLTSTAGVGGSAVSVGDDAAVASVLLTIDGSEEDLSALISDFIERQPNQSCRRL
jgi:hypothetical protein